jgi:hypothetical protein
MHILRPWIERLDGLLPFANAAAENPVTQGVFLDLNPIWWAAYCLARAGLNPDRFDVPLHFGSGPHVADIVSLEAAEGDEIDFTWIDRYGRVESLSRHLRQNYDQQLQPSSLPFIAKVIAKPVGAELFETRERLVSLAAAQSFLAIVETRPLGRLALTPGDSCLAGSVPGTVGGFLRDRHAGTVYAATCGHVAQKGAQVSVLGQHLGVVSMSHPPVPLGAGLLCTRGCATANRLDLALIDVGAKSVANTVNGISPRIAGHQTILLRGGFSGANPFEVGGVGLTYCPGNSNVCFENLFEVRPKVHSGALNPRIRAVFATVPMQGDSGGWVETSPGSDWCGVLVAVDGFVGYALEAEDVLTEADLTFGTHLSLA